MTAITLPHNWQPRDYQRKLWSYLENGGKRAVAIWGRRQGKDDVALHWTAVSAMQTIGNHWHMLPQQAHCRKAIWNAINPHTKKFRIDEAFPQEIRHRTLDKEMLIEFKSGSTWQLVGSDNYNSLVGSPPVGLVFSEFALADPNAWSYLEPILEENGGWALFITTPRGQNHAAKFYRAAESDSDWFAQILPATETNVFAPEQLAKIRKGLVDRFGEDVGDARYRQEYLCSFTAQLIGSYYGKAMEQAEADGRISSVPYDPRLPVHTAWDLGIGDATAIWFAQIIGKETRLIDYLEHSGVGVDYYVKKLNEKRYSYGSHILPHDASVRELGTGKSRVEVLRSLGMRDIRIIPAQNKQDGINAVHMTIPTCWFDKEKCKRGIECLQNYRREFDEKRGTYNDAPYHDWSSHGADAFIYLALGNPRNRKDKPIKYSNVGIV